VIPWYIMTSSATHQSTKNFFKKHNYFGLLKENIKFFQQGTLPAMTPEGKVILESKSKVFVAPDGNGGLFRALKDKGILDDMQRRGIQYVAQYCVDNILSKVADPVFIGFCASTNSEVGCKVVKKVDPAEKIGLIVSKDGCATVVEYSEILPDVAARRIPSGDLELRAGHMCINCFSLEFLNKAASTYKTKFHIARKKIPTVNDEGKKFTPDKENGWKLEQFIFDPFEFVAKEKFVVLEVLREEEFSALKNPPGSKSDSPDTARQDVAKLHKKWISRNGGVIKDALSGESLVEVSATISYDGEDLHFVKDQVYQAPLHLI